MKWAEYTRGGEGWTWLYQGQPCDLIAVGMGDDKAEALKVRLENKAEIVCYFNEEGVCPDLEYGPAG